MQTDLDLISYISLLTRTVFRPEHCKADIIKQIASVYTLQAATSPASLLELTR